VIRCDKKEGAAFGHWVCCAVRAGGNHGDWESINDLAMCRRKRTYIDKRQEVVSELFPSPNQDYLGAIKDDFPRDYVGGVQLPRQAKAITVPLQITTIGAFKLPYMIAS
jgi:hypothetical protein